MRQLVRDVRVIAAAVFIVVLTLVLSVGGAWVLALHAANSSQHRWCTTLTLLTAEPVPKPAHPSSDLSRERAYVFYVHLKDLERQFGC